MAMFAQRFSQHVLTSLWVADGSRRIARLWDGCVPESNTAAEAGM